MKKSKLKKLALCVLSFFLLLPTWSIHSNAEGTCSMSTEEVSAIIDWYISACGGRYWNKNFDSKTMHRDYLAPDKWIDCTTDYACNVKQGKSHNRKHGCTSNAYGGLLTYASSGQCQAFVSYMVDVIFGENAEGQYKKLSGQVPDDFTVKPGDVIRYKTNHGSQHAVMVYRVSGDSFSIVQCNAGGKCLISSGNTFVSAKKDTYSSCTMTAVRKMLKDKNAVVWLSPATQSTQKMQTDPVGGDPRMSMPDPVISPLGYEMMVNVGTGSTLRFCSAVSTADQYEIGSIPNSETVYVYGITTQSYEDRIWAKIQYKGIDGWVNCKWLAEKPVAPPPPPPTPTSVAEYTICYFANGGFGNMSDSEMICGMAAPLRANSFLRDGFIFSGWSRTPYGSAEYYDGQYVDLSATGGVCIDLFAQWEPVYTESVQAEELPTDSVPVTTMEPEPAFESAQPPVIPLSVRVSSNTVLIDRAFGNTSYVAVYSDGELPVSWYWNLAAAGPFICEWIDNNTFAINATDLGSAELEVWLCDGTSDQILAKGIIQVTITDSMPMIATNVKAVEAPPLVCEDAKPTLSISEYTMPSHLSSGQNFGIRGIVNTDRGLITAVYGAVTDAWNSTILSAAYFPYEASHDLRYSINNDLMFGQLPPGDYRYSVAATAVNGSQETTETILESWFTVETPKLSPASGLRAEYYDVNSAFVSWDAVPGTAFYEVQYFSRGQNAWTPDGSYVSGTTYISTGLDKYDSWQYRVRAVNADGYSDWAEITYFKA